MPELVLRLKPQQCMIKQGPFKLRETQEFALQMITGVSSTLKKKKSPRHFFFFKVDHDGRQTLKGKIHLTSNTTIVCSI